MSFEFPNQITAEGMFMHMIVANGHDGIMILAWLVVKELRSLNEEHR